MPAFIVTVTYGITGTTHHSIMRKYMSIILGIIGKKKEIPESIIGRFWSIIDLSLYFSVQLITTL